MKKILTLFVLFGLTACGGLIKNENGSQYLVKLDAEPIGCTFLYKLETEVSVYDADDARRYMENRNRYGAGEETDKSFHYMVKALEDFIMVLHEEAETPQQKQMLNETLQKSMR